MDTSVSDLLYFIDKALDGMVDIVTELGDELANQAPDLPGANSPYVILTHCLGVMEFWGGYVVAGREISRDRASEFVARGSVAELVNRVPASKAKLRRDVEAVSLVTPVSNMDEVKERYAEPYQRCAGPLDHTLEELAQHQGHIEITRDMLLREASRSGRAVE